MLFVFVLPRLQHSSSVSMCVPPQQPASHDCEKDLPLQLCSGIIGPQDLLRDKQSLLVAFLYILLMRECKYDFLHRHPFMFACLCVSIFKPNVSVKVHEKITMAN